MAILTPSAGSPEELLRKYLPELGLGADERLVGALAGYLRLLNKWNQVWDAPNVFVTDGSCMTSASCVNPSLTYMALTARAANYAVEELKKMNL